MKKILYLVSLLIAAVGMTGCVQSQEDVFDEASSIRLSDAIMKYRDLLTEAPNGWIIDYYDYDVTNSKAPTVGYAMYWKFNGPEVTMACEAKTGVNAITPATSEWDIIPAQGPVLSFNLYNPVIDFFCDPTGASGTAGNEGKGGDFEFVIMGETEDGGLLLKGRRHDVKMILHPLAAGENGIDYLTQSAAMALTAAGASNFIVKHAGDSIASAQAAATRILTFNYKDAEDILVSVTKAYAYTPTGIRLQEPVEVKGITLSAFTWDDDEKTYTATDPRANVVLVSKDKFPAKPTLPPGAGTDSSPYLVSKEGHLLYIGSDLSGVYRMTADINLEGAWIPVAGAFTGKFYGDNHQIKNISVNSDAAYVGFFGELGDGAYIKGVNIVGGSINSIRTGDVAVRIGAIAGTVSGAATITECSNSATITTISTQANNSGYAAGGIIGFVNGSGAVTISSCVNRGNVGNGSRVGGILGAKEGSVAATISNCYSNATITGTSTSTNDAIGGIIGSVANVALIVENSYSAGNVIASGSTRAIGGIAGGRNMGTAVTVRNSVVLLDKLQMASTGSTYFFRVQGYTTKATLTNNYANSGMQYLYNNTTAKTPTKNTANDQDGADVALADAKTAAWYGTNLPTWDFTNTWKITNGSLPTLKWE
ncbi:MAG: DUF4302 domain-containing protein [Candidatus Symbiothrix sp.]|jgi:hypothetical protein|nr:DUF4302 domain-containing protein [Candidatus Symbiothrix sp.]